MEDIYDSVANVFRQKVPIAKYGTVVHRNPVGGYAYNESDSPLKSEILLYLDTTERDLLLLCDGTQTVHEISHKLTEKHGVTFERVCAIIDLFLWQNVIEFKTTKGLSSFEFTVTGDLSGYLPMHLVIELTSKCNFRCSHCYRESEPDKGDILPLSIIRQSITYLVQRGCGIIEITGGEPLMNPEALEFLKFCCNLPLQVVVLSTNGYFIDENFISEVKEYIQLHKLVFSVTIDSSSPYFHDMHRGVEGSWERAVNAARLIAGNKGMVRIVMNILPGNMEDTLNTLLLARNIGAFAFALNPIVSIGRGIGIDYTSVKKTILEKYQEDMRSIYAEHRDFIYISPPEVEQEIQNENCGLAHRSWTIGASGEVRPCVMIPEGLLSLGNIITDTIEKISVNPVIALLRSFRSPGAFSECNSCEYNTFCSYCIFRGICAAQEHTSCNIIRKHGLLEYINTNKIGNYRCELETPDTLSFRR